MENSLQTATRQNDSGIDAERRMREQRAELADIVRRHCPQDGMQETAIPGLALFRGSTTCTASCGIASSIFAMMAQGAKRIQVGDDSYDYDAAHYLISSVELPIFSQLTRASVLEPYLGFGLRLDPVKVGELCARLPKDSLPTEVDRGIAVAAQSVDIQEAALRLARLLDTPDDIPILAPLAEQELLYRLLTGALGLRLHQAVSHDSHSHRIVRAISLLQLRLAETISIDEMAALANMSKSSLHHHFKALTGMTPLQYQKQLRLQEARRIMLTHNEDAASAAHRVGYESPSQFSREYRRMFGTPPASDVARLRGTVPAVAV